MTLVNAETGEVVEPMSEADARRLTERIRITATNYAETKAKLLELVDMAKAGAAHVSLGYKSWTAYLSDVLSDEPLRLARDDRRELVPRLRDEGMSTPAIAKVLGVNAETVRRDDIAATSANAEVDEPPKVRETEGLDGRVRLTVVASPPAPRRATPRPEAERSLNLLAMYLEKAASEAKTLTPDQVRRIKPKADLWTVGLRNSMEVLEHLLTSLTEEK